GYKYPHNYPGGYVEQDYLPSNIKDREYYKPSDEGAEAEIKKRMASRKYGKIK
ncbi:MAG: replication-associated recombination protein A, partial [Actinomycetota bacterium]